MHGNKTTETVVIFKYDYHLVDIIWISIVLYWSVTQYSFCFQLMTQTSKGHFFCIGLFYVAEFMY